MKHTLSILLFFLASTGLFAQTSNIQIDADFFELDAKNNFVVASGNVIVTQDDMVIYGDKGHYNQSKESIHLTGDVRISKGELMLYCKRVKANGKTKSILATGDVQFSFEELKGRADQATYDVDSEEVILDGNPIAWQGQDQIKGDMIVVNLRLSKVITKGKARVFISPNRF